MPCIAAESVSLLTPLRLYEIVIGAVQVTYQHEVAAVRCQTFYEYVNPGQASVTFDNFDAVVLNSVVQYFPSVEFLRGIGALPDSLPLPDATTVSSAASTRADPASHGFGIMKQPLSCNRRKARRRAAMSAGRLRLFIR